MAKLATCSSCHGFVPTSAARCPNCDVLIVRSCSRWSRIGRHLLAAVSGGAAMMTLMACYGMAYRGPMEPMHSAQCAPGQYDHDRDGFCTPEDCDDSSRRIHPNGQDLAGDGVDSNCDGVDGLRSESDPSSPSSTSEPGATPAVTPRSGPATDGGPAADSAPAPERAPAPMVTPTSAPPR